MGWLSNIPDVYYALAGALFGGTGLEALRWFLEKSVRKDNSATEFRKELRSELVTLRDELRRVNEDLDRWRGKYYELMDQFVAIKARLTGTTTATKDEVDPQA